MCPVLKCNVSCRIASYLSASNRALQFSVDGDPVNLQRTGNLGDRSVFLKRLSDYVMLEFGDGVMQGAASKTGRPQRKYRRQVCPFNTILASRGDHKALDKVFEFANIAGPVICLQRIGRLGRK